jgi:cytochrome c oxidase cbb3-type subunit 4
MALVSGIATLIALIAFVGIVWWAFSRGRAEANHAASLLPFAVPDELQNDRYTGESHE